MKINLKLIAVLTVSHFFIDITGSALPAIMPFFKEALGLNYAEIGAVIMVSNIASSIIQPCLGYFSDRAHIGWLLPLSAVLTYGGFSLVGLAPSYALLLGLVALSGIGVAVYHPESFKITHYFTGDRKATGMSLFQMGGNFGMAFGPLFVAFAVQMSGLRGTLLFLIPGAVIFFILLSFLRELVAPLREGTGDHRTRVREPASARPRRRWLSMGLLILAVALRSWVQMGLITFAPFYYITVLHGDALGAGRLVFAFMIGGALGTVGGGLVADRIGHKRFVSLSLLSSVPLLFLFLQISALTSAFVVIFFVGFALISSFSVTVVMGQTLLRDRLGMASGLMLGFVVGMGGVGAGCLGLVADALGIATLLRIIAVMPALALIPLSMVSYPAGGTNAL